MKIGDRVERINSEHQGMKVGDIGTIIAFHADGSLHLKEYGELNISHSECNFKVVMKKIIGYKAPTDLFKGVVIKDTIYKDFGTSQVNQYSPENKLQGCYSLPKEIVETWEPVYEETIREKIIYIGTWYGTAQCKNPPKNNVHAKCNANVKCIANFLTNSYRAGRAVPPEPETLCQPHPFRTCAERQKKMTGSSHYVL